jgi:hypothetical protein
VTAAGQISVQTDVLVLVQGGSNMTGTDCV